MPEIAAQFEAAGHVVSEHWWEHRDIGLETRHLNELEDQATRDFIGVVRADALIVINAEKSEGKAAEMGVAIALMKPVILIGKRTNIFHFLPSVHPVKDVRAAIRKLAL